MIDPRLAPLLAEALALGMNVSISLSDGEYDVFCDGFGRICDTQEEVCTWLDAEIGAYCRSRGLVRNMPSFADLRPVGEPLTVSMISATFSAEDIEKIQQAFSSAEPGGIVAIQDKYQEIANLVTSPYRTAADQERLLSFQEEAARISKHTKPEPTEE